MPDPLKDQLTSADYSALLSRFFSAEDRIVIGVSGGPDSMALLVLLAEWKTADIHAVTVDHGLRQQSGEEALAVARFCAGIGVAHSTLHWNGRKPTSGIQAAARSARYGLLCDFVRSRTMSCLVTAHHADDQAETVLIRMTSGSGIAGLAGMRQECERTETAFPYHSVHPVRHVRPLLSITKQTLVGFCRDRGIPFVIDGSNEDKRFDRGRLRRLQADLDAEGLTQARLLRLADRAAQADDALRAYADEAMNRYPITHLAQTATLSWRDLAAYPTEIRLRVLSAALQALSEGRFVEKRERLEALIDELHHAVVAVAPLRRSLGHWLITLKVNGTLVLSEAPQRRRGSRHET